MNVLGLNIQLFMKPQHTNGNLYILKDVLRRMKCGVCDKEFEGNGVRPFIVIAGYPDVDGRCCSQDCATQWHKNRKIIDACSRVWAVSYVDLVYDRITGDSIKAITALMNLVDITTTDRVHALIKYSGKLYTKAEGERVIEILENTAAGKNKVKVQEALAFYKR